MHLADELHITQRLVEGMRDMLDAAAVHNGTRQQGRWLVRTKWAGISRKPTFARNYRTYHLRCCLAVTMADPQCAELAPAVLIVVWHTFAPSHAHVHASMHTWAGRAQPQCTCALHEA